MPVEFMNFPVVNIVNGLVDFSRYLFSTPGITPNQWRFSANPEETKIIIRGGFGGEDIKVGAAPEIIVARNSFGFANSSLDNLEKADGNTFSNPTKRDWMVGSIDVICGSRSQNEADCMASFMALMIQSERHTIRHNFPFLKDIKYSMIGPATPAGEDVKQRRWLTTLRLNVELNMNWTRITVDDIRFNQLELYTVQNGNAYESLTGSVVAGETVLVDPNADYGYTSASRDKLDRAELEKGWYYAFLGTMTTKFKIVDIVDANTLKIRYESNLSDHDVSLEEDFSGPYKIVWNNVHFATAQVAA